MLNMFARNQVRFLLLACFLFLCAGCKDSSKRNTVQDVNKYMQVSSYVATELADNYSGILPPKDVVTHHSAEYYYSDYQPSLGNPSFIIYLNNKNLTEDVFLKEKVRIIKLSDGSIAETNSKTIYFVNDLETAIGLYTDNEAKDGMRIKFELAIVDEQTQTIEYLVASQQDGYEKSEIILEILNRARQVGLREPY